MRSKKQRAGTAPIASTSSDGGDAKVNAKLARECARQAHVINEGAISGDDDVRVQREMEALTDYRDWR